MSPVMDSRDELVQRVADSLRTSEPEFAGLWKVIRLGRSDVIDLSSLISALAQDTPRWTLEEEQRSVLYGLLAQESSVIGSTRDKTPIKIDDWPAVSESSDPVEQQVVEIARHAVDGTVRFRNRVLDKTNRYFAFSPAWEVEAILPEVFGTDDPAVVIGEHLRTLFDEERLVDEAAGIFLAAAPASPEVPTVLTRLVSLALGAPDLSLAERTVLSFIEEISQRRQWDLTGLNRAAKILALVGASLQSDQRLFVAFLNTLICNGIDFEATPVPGEEHVEFSRALYKAATQLLFIYSITGESDEAPLRLTDDLDCGDQSTRVAQIAADLDALIEKLSSRDNGRPFLPPQLLPHVLQLHGIFEEMHSENTDAFMRHVRAGVQYRSETLRGYAQYELSGGYLLQSVLESHRLDAVREDDLTYQLGQVWLEASDPDNAVITYLPLWRGYGEYSTPDAERLRAREYAVLLRSAIAEGFPVLADAVAAFFVFSQSLRYRGRLEPWSVVSEIIASAAALRESRHTQAALGFASELARHFGEQLLVHRIAPTSAQKHEYTTVAGNLPGIGFAHRETVAKDVVELIGEARRSKLSDQGFELLVGAHYKMSKLQKELIFGVLRDWGGIATEFTKVFEIELSESLNSIIRSDDYRQFKAARKEQRFVQGRPTLGSFLHLLSEYAELPTSLQLKLQAASELHTNSALLKQLERIVSEHRNPAAHAAAYGQQKFQELLRLLYTEKVLLEFIDALRPRTEG